MGTEDFWLIASFDRDQHRRGLSERTIESRAYSYGLFVRWLNGKPLTSVEREDIEQFLDTRNLSPRARYRWISDLHVLYEFFMMEELVTDDPTAKIRRPKTPRLLPRPIGTIDLAEALELASRGLRAMLALAAFQGMRCIEISRLVREDIHDTMTPATMIVRGKGDKPRPVPIHPEVWVALQNLPLPRAGAVFRTPDGKPLPAWKVSRLGNDYLHDIGIDSTMHKLRHWFGTSVYRTSGHDLLLVAELLGHSNMETTRGYAAYDRNGATGAVYQLTTQRGAPCLPAS